jgi:uncharacterized integral membrane protein (TIGR00697 family)
MPIEQQQTTKPPLAYSPWFVLVTSVLITCLITANITAVKLVSVFGLVLPAAIIIFPISYIFGDILTEVYGYRRAWQVIWLGSFCNLIAVVAIWLGQILPPASFWDGQEAYERILGYPPRLLAASFLAYLVGEFANSFVLAKMKIATSGRGCGPVLLDQRWCDRDWTRSSLSPWHLPEPFRGPGWPRPS